MSLQYLLKKGYEWSSFEVHQDQNFYKLDYRLLMKVARHFQKLKKGSLLNFCNILSKSIATAFVFYCDAKHSDTLQGSSHVCCYLFLGEFAQKWGGLLDHGTLKSESQKNELIK